MVKGIRLLKATDLNIYQAGIGTRKNPFRLAVRRDGLFGPAKNSILVKTGGRRTTLLRTKNKKE